MTYIVKSEKCFSCHRRADSWEDDDGEVTIICSLELDAEGKEEGDCPNYLFEAGREAFLPGEEEPVTDNIVIEEVKPYVFAGDSLVELIGINSDQEMKLRPSFVEQYNAAIQALKDRAVNDARAIEQALVLDLLEMHDALERVYRADPDSLDPETNDKESMLMLLGPTEGDDDEDEDFFDDSEDIEGGLEDEDIDDEGDDN